MKVYSAIFAIVSWFLLEACKDDGIGPLSYPNFNGQYELCYQKYYNNNWEIFLNRLDGGAPQNISNNPNEDGYPAWSPDGKYIGFERIITPSYICLYDVVKGTTTYLKPDSADCSFDMWTPDGRIEYSVWKGNLYIINPDGSNRRKIYTGAVFYYPDSYTMITSVGDLIYRTNLDGTIYELVLDLKSVGTNYVHYSDFNPSTGDLLIISDPTPSITKLLLTYNVDNKKIDTLSIADPGWMYVGYPKFSHDYKKVIVEDVNYSSGESEIYRLSLLENGIKTILVEFSSRNDFGGIEGIIGNSLTFSPDDRYITFSKSIYPAGTMAYETYSLEVINLLTKEKIYIDEGKNPTWNPKKSQ